MMIFCIEYFQPALGFAPITKCLTKKCFECSSRVGECHKSESI